MTEYKKGAHSINRLRVEIVDIDEDCEDEDGEQYTGYTVRINGVEFKGLTDDSVDKLCNPVRIFKDKQLEIEGLEKKLKRLKEDIENLKM